MFTASPTTMTTLSSRFTTSLRIAPHRVADAKPRTAVIECAHKKGTGSVKNGRDGNAKYLGVKKYGEEKVTTGCIIVRQRGNKFHAGDGVGTGKDFTLFALRDGEVLFKVGANKKKFVTVVDAVDRSGRADGLPTRKDKRRAMYTPRDDLRWAEESGTAVEVRTVEPTVRSAAAAPVAAPKAPKAAKSKTSGGPPKGQYRQVNKVRYDNHALLAMDAIMAAKGELNLDDCKMLYVDVQDGGRVTATECDTLEFVANGGGGKYAYKCTEEAKAYLLERAAMERVKFGEGGAR